MTSFPSDPNGSILLKTKQKNPRNGFICFIWSVLLFPPALSNQWRIYISCVLFIKFRSHVWRFSYWVLAVARVSFRSHTQALWILDSLVRHTRTNLWLSWSCNPQRQQRGKLGCLSWGLSLSLLALENPPAAEGLREGYVRMPLRQRKHYRKEVIEERIFNTYAP